MVITDVRRGGRRRTRDKGLFSASSSGASFLVWFRKARNESDWWWRARDHGKREREVWVRGRGCSSLITLQWLSFGYQFPWWSVYVLPPWGLRLSEIFLGYIFNVSQLNNAISLLSSLVRRLHLIYAWYARKSSSADWRTTTWQWNLEIVCHYEVFISFIPYQLLEEESRSLYRGVQLTKEIILSGTLSWLCDIVPA